MDYIEKLIIHKYNKFVIGQLGLVRNQLEHWAAGLWKTSLQLNISN